MLAGALVFVGGRWLALELVSRRITREAAARGLTASWQRLGFEFGGRISASGLRLTDARGDTVLAADSMAVQLRPWLLLVGRPEVRRFDIAHVQLELGRREGVDPDTLPPIESLRTRPTAGSDRLARAANDAVRVLLIPARRLPHISMRDVTVRAVSEDALVGGAELAWAELVPDKGGARLSARGALELERRVPFELDLIYGRDDRVSGGGRIDIPVSDRRYDPLRVSIAGRVHQERGRFEIGENTRITIGQLPLNVSGSLDRNGPRLRFALEADSVTEGRVIRSIPRVVLGPLTEVSVQGRFDYRLSFDLDLSRPDQVEFAADVIPHGLTLDPRSTRLELLDLDQPFTATIHLPRGRTAKRQLSVTNPHYMPLERIDSTLTYAVVTNEDGGFFRHRGFNTGAVKDAIVENIRAGRFRRGAGTITMQLARNLYLGHERTVSRKMQEVVMAWVLEHLTELTKQRLLEIYLNIIEWGPGVHGADEAAHYYFGRDASNLTTAEALFLCTVIPAPTKWRYRFDRQGNLRPFARAQMHFIGRAMAAKGWLKLEELAPTDSLAVELKGPAREVIFPEPPTDARSI